MLKYLVVRFGGGRVIRMIRLVGGLTALGSVAATALFVFRWPPPVGSGLAALIAAGWSAYVDQREWR